MWINVCHVPKPRSFYSFLPQMRSKDLWQNESGTTESWKIVKNILESFLEVLVLYKMIANLELGNLNIREHILTSRGMYLGPVSAHP